jgi:hypothetical protein
MSVQVNTYVLVGAKFDYDDLDYDSYSEYEDSAFEGIKHRNNLCVLSDGMNGEYIFIGHIKAKTENHEHFENPVDCSVSETEKHWIYENISANFKEISLNIEDIKTWVVSYYR